MRMARRIFTSSSAFSESSFDFSGDFEFNDEGNGKWNIAITSDGTLTLKATAIVDMYLLGGGQSGGYGWTETSGSPSLPEYYYYGGPGGQGGFIYKGTHIVLAPGTYHVVVGQGGAAGGNHVAGGTTRFGTYQAPGGGSGATGYEGGAAGGAACSSGGTRNHPISHPGTDSTVYDFSGINRGGGGGSSYGAFDYPYGSLYKQGNSGKKGEKGGGGLNESTQQSVDALPNYGGGGEGSGGARPSLTKAGGSGFIQIRSAR